MISVVILYFYLPLVASLTVAHGTCRFCGTYRLKTTGRRDAELVQSFGSVVCCLLYVVGS